MEHEPPSGSHVLPGGRFLQEIQYHTESHHGSIQCVWISGSHQMGDQEEIGHRVAENDPCDDTVEEHGCRKMAQKPMLPYQGHREQGCQ
jgi:hypothetical protein